MLEEDYQLRKLWNFVEALSIRLQNLEKLNATNTTSEEISRPGGGGSTNEIKESVDNLASRLQRFEENVNLRYNMAPTSERDEAKISCPSRQLQSIVHPYAAAAYPHQRVGRNLSSYPRADHQSKALSSVRETISSHTGLDPS